MTWESIVAGVVVISGAALWYGLQVVALRDLRERPSVRGGNKLIWALGILCLPLMMLGGTAVATTRAAAR